MSAAAARFLTHPLLAERGVEHGFGLRGWRGPENLVRPEQVHGTAVARVGPDGQVEPDQADAIWSEAGGPPVAIVTADCVPVLLCDGNGERVAAIHAGWRGLAAGIIEAAGRAGEHLGGRPDDWIAVIGPHVGDCCYEVDAPVRRAFVASDPDGASRAFAPGRDGHWMLDLGVLATRALERTGMSPGSIGRLEAACTACDAKRFESVRREAGAAGRMVHVIEPTTCGVTLSPESENIAARKHEA